MRKVETLHGNRVNIVSDLDKDGEPTGNCAQEVFIAAEIIPCFSRQLSECSSGLEAEPILRRLYESLYPLKCISNCILSSLQETFLIERILEIARAQDPANLKEALCVINVLSSKGRYEILEILINSGFLTSLPVFLGYEEDFVSRIAVEIFIAIFEMPDPPLSLIDPSVIPLLAGRAACYDGPLCLYCFTLIFSLIQTGKSVPYPMELVEGMVNVLDEVSNVKIIEQIIIGTRMCVNLDSTFVMVFGGANFFTAIRECVEKHTKDLFVPVFKLMMDVMAVIQEHEEVAELKDAVLDTITMKTLMRYIKMYDREKDITGRVKAIGFASHILQFRPQLVTSSPIPDILRYAVKVGLKSSYERKRKALKLIDSVIEYCTDEGQRLLMDMELPQTMLEMLEWDEDEYLVSKMLNLTEHFLRRFETTAEYGIVCQTFIDEQWLDKLEELCAPDVPEEVRELADALSQRLTQ